MRRTMVEDSSVLNWGACKAVCSGAVEVVVQGRGQAAGPSGWHWADPACRRGQSPQELSHG